MWEINLEMVESGLDALDQDSYEQVVAAFELLEERGPQLGQPLDDSVTDSRHKHMRESRPKRPVDRDAVAAHKKRMLEEVHAYRLRELRETRDFIRLSWPRGRTSVRSACLELNMVTLNACR